MKLLTHCGRVDSNLVGQIDCHGVLLLLHRGERAAKEPALCGKVRVWDDGSGGVPEEVGVVPQDSAAVLQTPSVVEGCSWLGGHPHLL